MPRAMRSQAEQCSAMIVGIDFGTTYSGIAFAHSSKPGNIQVVSNWVDGRNTDKGKCPTLLTYAEDKVAAWGYGAVDQADAVKWFKLLLAQPSEIPADVRESDELRDARRKIHALGKQAVDLVADFLKKLWGLTLQKMAKAHSQALVDSSRFYVVLTVPAIWHDDAKEMMREAAQWAGICSKRPAGDTGLDLVSEPEAAALATISDNFDVKFSPQEPFPLDFLKNGECFVVADLGGGTADLITYKVKSQSPWQIEECVKGEGKLCGAVLLDKAFRDFLEAKVGPEVWQLIRDDRNLFAVQWEKVIKREFREDSQEHSINIPYPAHSMPRDWKPVIPLSSENLLAIFDPVTSNIIDLVSKQISKIPRHHKFKGQLAKYLVLVGGLGSSQHVYERLKSSTFSNGPGPEILQSEGDLPWTAISRGAVLHGFNLLAKAGQRISDAPSFAVESRIARRSIGTVCTFEEYDPQRHLPEDRRYCPVEDVYVADSQMSWFVEAHEALLEGEFKRCDFSQTFEEEEDMEEGITTEFVYSDSAVPPKRCDESVNKLCDVRWTRMPSFDTLPIRTTDAGKEVRDVFYTIEMAFRGASAHFSI